jgi:hypothetical protein
MPLVVSFMSGSKRVKGSKRPGSVGDCLLEYLCERLLCDHCGAENPQTNVRSAQTRDIFVRFITTDACFAQAVDLNLVRTLGPRVPVVSPKVPRAGYWPTWAPPMGRYANTIAPTRATAKATCASLSSPAARTCSASANDSGMSLARTYTRTAL